MALLVVVALVMAVVLGRGRQRRPSGAWIAQSAHWIQHWRTQQKPLRVAVIVWTVLVLAVVVLAVIAVLRLWRWLVWLAVALALGVGVPAVVVSVLFVVSLLHGGMH